MTPVNSHLHVEIKSAWRIGTKIYLFGKPVFLDHPNVKDYLR